MNRRDFFKSLGVVGFSIFLPKFDPVRWKMLKPSGLWVPNHAYLQAPYQFIDMDIGAYISYDLLKTPKEVELDDPKGIYPIRYSLIDPVSHLPVPIPPFIKQ